MKLVVQIPCYNEEKTLGLVLAEIPKKIKGIDKIEIQVIDDGSRDKTIEVAKKFKVDRIIRHKFNKGLGISFADGMEAALESGADILVNTDGDNQYPSKYITDLVSLVINNGAEIVIGDRQTDKVQHFSSKKKFLQKFGSAVVRYLSGTEVPDAVSGFRAYSREAMLEINVISKFSYCIDTIVQAGKKGLKIVSVPITVNKPTRNSRLFKNIWQHIKKSTANLLRVFVIYEPFKTFIIVGTVLIIPALIFMFRFIYFYFFVPIEATGHIQSLVLGSALFMGALQMYAIAIMADLIRVNRMLIEKNLKIQKQNVRKL